MDGCLPTNQWTNRRQKHWLNHQQKLAKVSKWPANEARSLATEQEKHGSLSFPLVVALAFLSSSLLSLSLLLLLLVVSETSNKRVEKCDTLRHRRRRGRRLRRVCNFTNVCFHGDATKVKGSKVLLHRRQTGNERSKRQVRKQVAASMSRINFALAR